MSEAERATLAGEVDHWWSQFDRGTRFWSAVYNGCLFGSIVCTALAVGLLKSEFVGQYVPFVTDVSAGLAGAGTLLTTMVGVGGFERKWRANRIARGSLNQIRIDLLDPAADSASIRSALKEALREEDRDVVGQVRNEKS